MAGPARGNVTIDVKECKGCGLCIDSCPPKCLVLEPELSAYGVHPAHYLGENCTGCGICFYCCPEPGAITVYRRITPLKQTPGGPIGATDAGEGARATAATVGGEHAATV